MNNVELIKQQSNKINRACERYYSRFIEISMRRYLVAIRCCIPIVNSWRKRRRDVATLHQPRSWIPRRQNHGVVSRSKMPRRSSGRRRRQWRDGGATFLLQRMLMPARAVAASLAKGCLVCCRNGRASEPVLVIHGTVDYIGVPPACRAPPGLN